jgi:hypothetical protein
MATLFYLLLRGLIDTTQKFWLWTGNCMECDRLRKKMNGLFWGYLQGGGRVKCCVSGYGVENVTMLHP